MNMHPTSAKATGLSLKRIIYYLLSFLVTVCTLAPFVLFRVDYNVQLQPLPSSSSVLASNEPRLMQNNFDILPKVLVIYFPQYHADPLNDKLWGVNFTDWDNLRKAPQRNKLDLPIPRPLPYNPTVTSDATGSNHTGLGYYNLRSKEIRMHQSNLAKAHHIDGFIYHHYWFYDPSNPGPDLHAPLMDMLRDGYPDMPYFLNWCPVTWVNMWMGRPIFQPKEQKINKNNLMVLQQQYFNASKAQIKEHYDWLRQFFHTDNYIKVKGEPVFLAYQWNEEMHHVLQMLRKFAMEDGFPGMYIIIGRGAPPPHIHDTTNVDKRLSIQMKRTTQLIDMFPVEIFNQTMVYPYPKEYINKPHVLPKWCGRTNEIPAYPSPREKPEIYGVPITFDNTPRRELSNANIWNYGPPEDVVSFFRKSLTTGLTFDTCCWNESHRVLHEEERFFVINAWNEWAEGMAMEPSDVFGMKFLETVKEVKEALAKKFGNGNGCN